MSWTPLSAVFEHAVEDGQQRLIAAYVPMYNAARTRARPPQTVRRPRRVPLSRLRGATSTRLEICLRPTVSSSGRSTKRVTESTREVLLKEPTPNPHPDRGRIFRRRRWLMTRSNGTPINHFASPGASARTPPANVSGNASTIPDSSIVAFRIPFASVGHNSRASDSK